MSFGSNSGTVRYALIVDDAQAERSLTTFKNNLTTLTNPTNTVTRNMQSMNQQFTAGVTPIKNQGNALANNTANLKANGIQAITLGTKIKDTTAKFAGFATGLAVTASGVLQLAAGFRDYNDAQIAVDRVTRKLSLATEAETKAKATLKKLTDQNIKSGKAYEQAQLDVSQAEAAVSIQTDLLGEAHERLFDSQTQFAVSIIPTTLGALGTLGSAFKDLGGTGGIGGLVEKFKGLGSGITSGFIPALTGIGSKAGDAIKGILGVGTASTVAAGGVGGLKAALSGLALSLGSLIGIPLGGILAANALGNTFKEFHDIGDQVRKGQLEMAKSLGLSDDQVKQLNDSMNAINKIFGVYEPQVKTTSQALADFGKTIKFITPQTDNLAASAAKVPKIQNAIVASFLTGSPAANDYSNMLIDLNKNIFENKTITGQQAKALSNIPDQYKTASTFASLFGDKTELAKIAVTKFNDATANNTGMDSFNAAIQAGADKFSDFVSQAELGAVTNKRYTDSLRQWVGQQIELPASIDLTTSELEAMATGLGKAKTDLAGMSEATKVLADALNNDLAPSLKTFNSVITADKWKDFKKALKDLPGFGDFSKNAKKDLSGFLNEFRKVGQIAKEVGTDISAMILGANFEGIKTSSLGNFIKELKKDVADISKIDVSALKFKPITDFLDSLTKENRAEGILKIKDSLALMQDAMADGVITEQEAAAVIAKFNEETGKTTAPVNKSAAAIKAFGVSSASARGQIDQVTGAIDVMKSQFDKIKPVVNINTQQALGLMGELKRAWDKVVGQIQKAVPKITVNTDKALDMIGTLKRAWDKVASQIEKKVPKITVNANQALDMIGEVKRGMDSIKSKSVSINVNATGSGLRFAQKGMHETLGMDTLIQAHKGERVDIGGGGETRSSGSSRGGGTGGGGDLTINNVIDIGSERIVRTVKRRLGQGFYAFGA